MTYLPDADENGSDSFEVQVSDGEFTDAIVVNVTINAINDAPVLDRDTMLFNNGKVEVGEVEVLDVDNDPVDFTFFLSGGADQLLFTLTADGYLSFKNPPDISAPGDDNADNHYEISVQVDDGIDTTEQAITVMPEECTYYVLPSQSGKTVVICM
mgnify:CR=1 FL=1